MEDFDVDEETVTLVASVVETVGSDCVVLAFSISLSVFMGSLGEVRFDDGVGSSKVSFVEVSVFEGTVAGT